MEIRKKRILIFFHLNITLNVVIVWCTFAVMKGEEVHTCFENIVERQHQKRKVLESDKCIYKSQFPHDLRGFINIPQYFPQANSIAWNDETFPFIQIVHMRFGRKGHMSVPYCLKKTEKTLEKTEAKIQIS